MSRDATKKARGFSYQRQYCIYIFLDNNNKKMKIIEEGTINNMTFEDITLINNNNEYITYQIKYHSKTMSLCKSNNDLFKTLKNKDNLKAKEIYFFVSKIEKTYDDTLNKWKNKNLTSNEIYEMIINLNGKDKSEIYKECYDFFMKDKEIIIDYLNKITIDIGFTYNELIDNINKKIKEIFNINDDIKIFYLRYYIFDLLEKNWFDNNIQLNIDDNITDMKSKINIINNESNNESIDNILKILHNNINNYFKNDDTDNNLTNILIEIEQFKKLCENYKEPIMKELIVLLNILHNINNKSKNNTTNNIYKQTKKLLCRNLIKNVNKTDNDNKINKTISSISYYYNHNINKQININKSSFKDLFDENDIKYINIMELNNDFIK